MSPSSDPDVVGGVLACDKPLDWTSHDVVAVARGRLGFRRVGHGGTLDPKATGLLPILVGPATKFADRVHQAPKVYAAVIRFGSETTTDDREGEVTRDATPPEHVGEEALERFRGPVSQVPPAFAAVKVGGTPAYRSARAGRPLDLPERVVTIERLEIATWERPDLRLIVVCSSGTYIRALARDLGRALGSAAHLGALRRLAVGALDVDGAMTIEELRTLSREAAIGRLRPATPELLGLPDRYRTAPAAELLSAVTWS